MTHDHWTASEKKIARRAYDAAVQRELAEILAEFKRRAASATSPAEMWAVEDYLKSARRSFDRKYDYRYSVLDLVLGRLLSEKRIQEADLRGLGEDKIARMRAFAALSRGEGFETAGEFVESEGRQG